MNVDDLYRLLRAGHVQAQGIVDTISDPMLVLDEGLRVQAASRSFFQTFKTDRDETIGQRIYDLGNGQWDIPELRLLLERVIPKSAAIINFEVEADFPNVGPKTMLLTARTLFHPDNASHSLLLAIVDATERRRQDVAKDMLFAELQHRMKNVLSVAQSMARLATTKGRSAEEYRDDFMGRFRAYVDAQDLSYSGPEETDIKAMVERILAPYVSKSEAVVIESSVAVRLDPRIIQSLSLVLHELATNAAKYGALSKSEGQVRIGWYLEEAGCRFRLRWAESGGPAVAPLVSPGYGTKLIQSAVTYSLGGTVEQEYAEGGLKAEIVIPLEKDGS